MDIGSMNIERAQALVKASKHVKIQYCVGEIGWAAQIAEDLAIVLNVPAFAFHLGLMDVVKIRMDDAGMLVASEVVWSAYDATTDIRYPATEADDGRSTYKALYRVAQSVGLHMEVAVAGIAMVCHGSSVCPRELFDDAGVDLSDVKFTTHLRWKTDQIRPENRKELREVYTQGITVAGAHSGSFDTINHGPLAEAAVVAIVESLPIPAKSDDPKNVCPPAVGFLKAAPSVFPNVARVEDGSYVILTGGTGADARKCRTVSLPEVLDWVHSIFAPPATHTGAPNDVGYHVIG